MSDLECPYCNAGNKVCHDDGAGYSESEKHEMECGSCGKSFIFRTVISLNYFPQKADCLNDAPHDMELTSTYPPDAAHMQCKNCEHQERR